MSETITKSICCPNCSKHWKASGSEPTGSVACRACGTLIHVDFSNALTIAESPLPPPVVGGQLASRRESFVERARAVAIAAREAAVRCARWVHGQYREGCRLAVEQCRASRSYRLTVATALAAVFFCGMLANGMMFGSRSPQAAEPSLQPTVMASHVPAAMPAVEVALPTGPTPVAQPATSQPISAPQPLPQPAPQPVVVQVERPPEPAPRQASALADVGPTEAEMRAAFQARVDIINGNLDQFRKTKIDKNNPMSALRRLAGEYMGNARLHVTEFEKLSAAPAIGQAGYICDFVARLEVKGEFGPMFRDQAKAVFSEFTAMSGHPNKGRFVETGRGWMFEPVK